MNRRKFLKALFSIPLLVVVGKEMAVNEPKPIENYTVDWRDSLLDGYIWPTGGPDFKWSHDKFFHPNEGLCELLQEVDRDATYDLINGTDNPECKFEGLRGFITTGKEQLQQLDDYSKTPFIDIQVSEFVPENKMIFVSKNGHITWMSNDDGLTWEKLDGTELPKPTA